MKKGENILDHMGSTELAANYFRITQTEEKLSVRQSENRPFDRQNSVRQTVRKLSPNNKEKKNNDSVKRHYECKEDESL